MCERGLRVSRHSARAGEKRNARSGLDGAHPEELEQSWRRLRQGSSAGSSLRSAHLETTRVRAVAPPSLCPGLPRPSAPPAKPPLPPYTHPTVATLSKQRVCKLGGS